MVGGGIGTLARYAFSGLLYAWWGARFPYGTMAVNLTGCFLIGFLAVLSEEKFLLGPDARTLLMIGFCGAYTTFSTFILESAYLIREGQTGYAFINIAASIILGFLMLRLGILTAELF